MGFSFPLEDLRLLLEKAKTADAELKQFGASHHKYELNPPASLRDIENFEWAIGISLPEDYRNFLLQAGDGGAGPFYGLFSIVEVQGWLGWDVEPDKTPYLRPDMDLKALEIEGKNWKRGCIPIESQGDTYFTCLMVTGPDRGRIVYVEYEGSWVFFPRQLDFMSWYTRWLRDVAAGYDLSWFGISLDGSEADLRHHYIETGSQEERLLTITSMGKFPALSKASQDFIRDALEDWTTVEDIADLPELAYRVDPILYEEFLDKRWKNGLFHQVLIALYHTPADKQALAQRWRTRILEKLPEVPTESYCITIPLLAAGSQKSLCYKGTASSISCIGSETRNPLHKFLLFSNAADFPSAQLQTNRSNQNSREEVGSALLEHGCRHGIFRCPSYEQSCRSKKDKVF